jgi:hypothetical protein
MLKMGVEVTPEQARARARAILEEQKRGRVITMNADGTLASDTDLYPRKRSVLHDPKGEY